MPFVELVEVKEFPRGSLEDIRSWLRWATVHTPPSVPRVPPLVVSDPLSPRYVVSSRSYDVLYS